MLKTLQKEEVEEESEALDEGGDDDPQGGHCHVADAACPCHRQQCGVHHCQAHHCIKTEVKVCMHFCRFGQLEASGHAHHQPKIYYSNSWL